jgi:FOG: Ankyrin repeat
MDIFQAAFSGDVQRIRYLISANVSANQIDENGRTPLHYACENGNFNIVQALIDAHADLNAQTMDNLTPLHLAAIGNHYPVVQTLIREHAILNPKSASGLTPLHMACDRGHSVVAQLLIQAHANIEAKNSIDCTPLHTASQRGSEEIVRTLLDAHAHVDVQAIGNMTPLHIAAANNHLETVRMLVQAGADYNKITNNGRKAVDMATDPAIITFLNNVPSLSVELATAVHNQDFACVLLLLALDTPVTILDKQGERLINHAIGAYDRTNPTYLDCIARELILASGPRGVTARNRNGQTQLHIAAMRGNLWIAELLLRNGANVNARDIAGNTPLHSITSIPMRDKLLRHGADVSLINDARQTPISANIALWPGIFEMKDQQSRLHPLTV